jgi:hypothetical protein
MSTVLSLDENRPHVTIQGVKVNEVGSIRV